jgi:hypothetical protein
MEVWWFEARSADSQPVVLFHPQRWPTGNVVSNNVRARVAPQLRPMARHDRLAHGVGIDNLLIKLDWAIRRVRSRQHGAVQACAAPRAAGGPAGRVRHVRSG